MKRYITMLQRIKKYWATCLPLHCTLCGEAAEHHFALCGTCFNALPWQGPACWHCGLSLSNVSTATLCGPCLKEKRHIERTTALFQYKWPIVQLLHELKFKRSLVNARLLGEILAEHFVKRPPTAFPDVIVPMPLHPGRLRERGFNQALELARPVALRANRPLSIETCKRKKATFAQATLPPIQRKANVRKAFWASPALQGLHVAVIDDVMTTGHTLFEFCKTLKKEGVHTIEVWCIARAFVKA